MNKLNGKIALVTGASKGIGASIAKHLAQAGAVTYVNYSSSKEGADATVQAITEAGGQAIAIQGDFSRVQDRSRVFASIQEMHERLDILVNNAGIYKFAPLESIFEEDFHTQFNLNVLGLLFASKAAVELMPASGGCIINIGSVAGVMPAPQGVIYSATKAAVDSITVTLSKELGHRGIRVNALNPGPVRTEGAANAGLTEGPFTEMINITPLGRMGAPEDIGPVAAFLASDDAGWLTGQRIYVSGGLTL